MTRMLGLIFGMGLMAGIMSVGLATLTGVKVEWIAPVLLGLGAAVVIRIGPGAATRHGPAWPGAVLLALGGWLFVFGLYLAWASPMEPWRGLLVSLAGVALGLPGMLRLIRAGRRTHAEAMAHVLHRANQVGGMIVLQTALLGGLLDFLDVMRLSGAQVGFAAAVLGVLIGLSAQAALMWRAGL